MFHETDDFWRRTFKPRRSQYSARDISFAPSVAIRFRRTSNPHIIRRVEVILGMSPREFSRRLGRTRSQTWKSYGTGWYVHPVPGGGWETRNRARE